MINSDSRVSSSSSIDYGSERSIPDESCELLRNKKVHEDIKNSASMRQIALLPPPINL